MLHKDLSCRITEPTTRMVSYYKDFLWIYLPYKVAGVKFYKSFNFLIFGMGGRDRRTGEVKKTSSQKLVKFW